MKLRNPLANAHNHGSARSGLAHWWAQRFSALLLIGLTVWLIWMLGALVGASHAEASAIFAHPFHATMAILFVVTGLHHGQLGLQVIIEDYVSGHGLALALVVAIQLLSILGGVLAVISILKLALGV